MKILFIDLLCPSGHKDINKYLLDILNELNNIQGVDLVTKKDYLVNVSSVITNKIFIPEKYFNYKGKFDYRLKNFLKIRWLIQNIDISYYDVVLVSSYETISFSLAWRKNVTTRTLVFNHNNVDELTSMVKKFFFKNIYNNVEHIVYEEFIKDYLYSLGVSNKIWINHHPLDFSKLNIIEKHSNNEEFLVLAPSSSNDDDIIKKLIQNPKRKKLLNDKIKLIVKSENIDFKDEQLTVRSDRIAYQDYIDELYSADIITLFFNKNFRYRVSGVFFDSLVFKKKILSYSNVFTNYYLNKYPELGDEFDNINQFLNLINKYFTNQNQYKSNIFENIIGDYSKSNIKQEIINILFND
ncbi:MULTISPECIES: hypothetical protein [unclassified Candidatus Frackibacter]|uniref:hypothetical protein n=1 Tax=unclassified Candidatus Frackibacter TaxID=2648818 RepID=UPI00088FFBDE|nr:MULTISPECIES: hypothetical protein [unclassified Candidatus Frackibacter]SDC07646.1 hypothetical protein SAMN04515661_10215 [Candidatus Frackibacter sp. WG11]SFL44439.1 hypothetical protein SAMN04488699_102196 [Candidatus Frackibacter sp. WG13]